MTVDVIQADRDNAEMFGRPEPDYYLHPANRHLLEYAFARHRIAHQPQATDDVVEAIPFTPVAEMTDDMEIIGADGRKITWGQYQKDAVIAAMPAPTKPDYWSATEELMNWLNSLDSSEMSGKDVRKAVYSKLLEMRPAPVASEDPCPYCTNTRTGLPGNACENCMNTGLANPTTSLTGDVAELVEALERCKAPLPSLVAAKLTELAAEVERLKRSDI